MFIIQGGGYLASLRGQQGQNTVFAPTTGFGPASTKTRITVAVLLFRVDCNGVYLQLHLSFIIHFLSRFRFAIASLNLVFCIAEADGTYGSIDNRLFNRFPLDEDADHTFEMAIAALQDACKAADPHNVVPPPAAVAINPLNAIGQVLHNQQQQHAQMIR